MHARSTATRWIAGAVGAVVAAALVAGCGGDDDEAATEQPGPASFAIEATSEGPNELAFEFPGTVEAGLVTMTLTNSDDRPRSAGIVRIVGDHTVDDVREALDEEGGPIPSFIQDGGGVPTVEPGESASVTQVLAPGRYAILDDESSGEGPDNAELGAKGEFTVTGPASDAELPAQPATVTATDDGEDEYGFDFAGLKAGVNEIRFENTGEELHHALFFPIRDGVTIDEVATALASDGPPEGQPPVDFAAGVGTQVIDGGIAQNMSLDLDAGRYAVVCFVQDREGGKPHVADGMIEELAIE